MQIVLPYIDDFLPVHNLNSLEELARHLNDLGGQRNLGPRYTPPAPPEPEPLAVAAEPREIDPALAPTFRHPLWGRSPKPN